MEARGLKERLLYRNVAEVVEPSKRTRSKEAEVEQGVNADHLRPFAFG